MARPALEHGTELTAVTRRPELRIRVLVLGVKRRQASRSMSTLKYVLACVLVWFAVVVIVALAGGIGLPDVVAITLVVAAFPVGRAVRRRHRTAV